MKSSATLPPAANSTRTGVSLDLILPLSRIAQPPSGALAFVPPEPPAGRAMLDLDFRAVVRKEGPAAAYKWLMQNSAHLKEAIKIPYVREVLAVAALGAATAAVGFATGYAAGNAARPQVLKLKALALGLKLLSEQKNLSARQMAGKVAEMLQTAASDGQRATPARGSSGAFKPPAHADSLSDTQKKLERATKLLNESLGLSEQNPSIPGQQEIVLARQASVKQLRAKVNALARAQAGTAGSQATLPQQKVPVVPPLPQAPQQSQPVPRVSELPGLGNGTTTGPSKSSQQPVRNAVDIEKMLKTIGDRDLERRLNDYAKNPTGDAATVTKGLTPESRKRAQEAIEKIDRSQLVSTGATGERANSASGRSDSNVRFTKGIEQTDAKDEDKLSPNSPATVTDVKKMLGELKKSRISITRFSDNRVFVAVRSEGFRRIGLWLHTSAKGIDSIQIANLSSTASKHDGPLTDAHQDPLGWKLQSRIYTYADANEIPRGWVPTSQFLPEHEGE